MNQTQAMRDQVWQWLLNLRLQCMLWSQVDDLHGVIGFLHYRTFLRPLTASTGGYVDDLFVAPQARGQGIAQQLIHVVTHIGWEHGWLIVCWMTASENVQARAAYDKLARHTHWQTYEIKLSTP